MVKLGSLSIWVTRFLRWCSTGVLCGGINCHNRHLQKTPFVYIDIDTFFFWFFCFFFLRWVFSACVSKGHLSRLNAASTKACKLCRKGDWLAFKMDGELCAELGEQSAGLVNWECFTSRTLSSR